MTAALIAVIVILAVALVALGGWHLRYRRRRPQRIAPTTRRILFPFTGVALSQRALDAALRLASAEHATLVPVFLARVSRILPLDTPLPRQSEMAMPLLEAVEHEATRYGVPFECRIERGRDYRHALREMIDHERYDRIVVAIARPDTEGFHAQEAAWLLEHAPGEIVILRPGRDERLETPAAAQQSAAPQESSAAAAYARQHELAAH